MNKIKIIELLNMISRGEELPKCFKVNNHTWEWNVNSYQNELYGEFAVTGLRYDLSNLNDEIEIIEEEKKPITKEDVEALGYALGEIKKCFVKGWDKSSNNEKLEEDKKIKKLEHSKEDDIFINGKSLLDKIDEIIDYINRG